MLISFARKRILAAALVASAALFIASTIASTAKAQEVDFAAQGLTPLGSEQKGNADGSIPPWKGGITRPPAGWSVGEDHVDPYADDKPLFTITPANYQQYRKFLTPGQQDMFRRFASYKMPIYPSHRSCALPQSVYRATAQNAARARLAEDGNGLEGALMGVPFPLPKSGLEAVRNHHFHYHGTSLTAKVSGANVYPNGRVTRIVRDDKRYHYYADPATASPQALNNAQYIWMGVWSAPSRAAGRGFSMTNTINQVRQPRPGFFYRPDVRKTVRATASSTEYDAPVTSAAGLRVSDNIFIYTGSPDRYQWQLKGKREMYIPYNAYRASQRSVAFKDMLTPNHLNPEFLRYEKHRVWVVEGTLKPSFGHVYHKRVFYLDEDSWIIVLADLYDSRGNLMRMQEGFVKNYYEIPACVAEFDVIYDLPTGRYNTDNMKNEFGPANLDAKLSPRDFGATALRRAVSR